VLCLAIRNSFQKIEKSKKNPLFSLSLNLKISLLAFSTFYAIHQLVFQQPQKVRFRKKQNQQMKSSIVVVAVLLVLLLVASPSPLGITVVEAQNTHDILPSEGKGLQKG
jgi:NADH:ubiquinone oxidoreductase subunit 5 (subunit L)/multisubunit Na+/H+ antiporter MnhA subunit